MNTNEAHVAHTSISGRRERGARVEYRSGRQRRALSASMFAGGREELERLPRNIYSDSYGSYDEASENASKGVLLEEEKKIENQDKESKFMQSSSDLQHDADPRNDWNKRSSNSVVTESALKKQKRDQFYGLYYNPKPQGLEKRIKDELNTFTPLKFLNDRDEEPFKMHVEVK